MIKKILRKTINRIIDLYHLLVKWNIPYPILGTGIVPNEYVCFDEILMDLKLDTSVLTLRIPNYFVEELTIMKERTKV